MQAKTTIPCSIEGCGRFSYAKGLCPRHYERQRVFGDALAPRLISGPRPVDPRTLFLRHVETRIMEASRRPDLGPCDIFTGAKNSDGYGIYRSVTAHVFANGKAPDGLEWDHLCGIRPCVKRSHLEAVAHAVNVARGLVGETNRIRGRAKTHCKAGHPFDEVNTYIDKGGARHCRTCRAGQMKAYYARHGR